MMTKAKWGAALAVSAVVTLGLAPAAGATGTGTTISGQGGMTSAPAGASAAVGGPAATAPKLTASVTSIYPPSAFCTSLGYTNTTSTTLTGTNLPVSTAYTVGYHAHKVATGTTSATGRFTHKATDFSQPDGIYKMVATVGTVKASTPVSSGGDSCWSAQGTTTAAIHFKWQALGFDASTAVTFLVNGAVFDTATTSPRGATLQKFTKGCPGTGTYDVTIEGSFGGTEQTFSAGTLNCT